MTTAAQLWVCWLRVDSDSSNTFVRRMSKQHWLRVATSPKPPETPHAVRPLQRIQKCNTLFPSDEAIFFGRISVHQSDDTSVLGPCVPLMLNVIKLRLL